MIMQTPNVSIVMPVFNAQSSVERAIRSVLAQSDPNFELIIIDDKSTDNSVEIITEVMSRAGDQRIRLLNQPNNQGVSAARNRGVKAARGAFISFIDSDDEYLPGYLATLGAEVREQVDIVVGGRIVVQPNGRTLPMSSPAQGTFGGSEAARLAMIDRITPFPWDKLFRRSLFSRVEFPVGAARFEDMTTNILLHSLARKVVTIGDPVYRYHISTESLTWGRVPSMEDAQLALDHLDEHIDPALKTGQNLAAYRAMMTLITLLIAQSAMASGREVAQVHATIASCRRAVPLTAIAATARVNPVLAAAASLFKVAPKLFSAVYLRHVNRSYGLSN